MNPNKALWEKGDFTRLAETMRESGEALVNGLGITKGLEVLDLGCGDGTTALPAARLGAEVLGVDIASNLVAAGNRRAEAEGLSNCRFQEGDASDLRELSDNSFDLVVSIFGAMFAPKPFEVAKEMVRVTRPGGRIVMGNWIPNHPTLVAQDPEGERRLHATAAGRLCQPDEVGCRERRNRAVRGRWRPEGEYIVRAGHVYVQDAQAAFGVSRHLQAILWADDERLRSRGKEPPDKRSVKGVGRSVHCSKQEREGGRNRHSRNLPAGHCRAQLVQRGGVA